jgi:hypothetical protein
MDRFFVHRTDPRCCQLAYARILTALSPRNIGHRAGLAVEPMTCAPDAFNAPPPDDSPRSILLDVGGSAVADWRIVGVDRDRSV